MKLYVIILAITAVQAAAKAAPKAEGLRKPSKPPAVMDLGELEIEGEIRRPNVNWVDSRKGMRDLIPMMHRAEFLALEQRLLQPTTLEKVEETLYYSKPQGGNNAGH